MYRFLICLIGVLCFSQASGTYLDKTGTLWAPYLEWSFENTTYPGNPFDLNASATFTHSASGETRTTEMFYVGDKTWKLRFTGTRTGVWTFVTRSADPELDGHYGAVTINLNPNPKIRGFLTSYGNKFARQVGENGELEAFMFNVYQGGYNLNPRKIFNNPNPSREVDKAMNVIEGFTVLYSGTMGNTWFKLEAKRWDEHNSEDPDLRTFKALETVIPYIHTMGFHFHFRLWGDETRRKTPIGVGGINGIPDRRLQRYIAARLGPLPGWSMTYGFDLQDWDWINGDTGQLDSWAKYMRQHMGWQHLLFTRGYAPPHVNGVSYSSNGPVHDGIQTSPNGPMSYAEVAEDFDSDPNRPHLYEERFVYLREFAGGPPWTMERTRSVMWWNIMAGGIGSWWGRSWTTGGMASLWGGHFWARLRSWLTFNEIRGGDRLPKS